MKLIVRFFLPILAGNFFQQLYNFIDSVIVGKRIGDAALAAVGNRKVPLIAMVLSSIMNIILDILFVFPGKMGVSGAAVMLCITYELYINRICQR